MQKFYLELSEDDGASHKYYEVIVDDTEVTISYGRIGTIGQTTTTAYPTPEKAKAAAEKKIKQKLKKGYEESVKGVRKKRPITRRQIDSKRSVAKPSPLLWKFSSGAPAFGIFIDSNCCLVGNQNGSVFVLDHEANILNQYRLPDGVKCIVADDIWIYAGCDDGCVYDLTGKLPRLTYEISANIDIFWLDIHNASLGVSDAGGTIMITNHENEDLWQRKSQGDSGWMVRCDTDQVFHGHSSGVTAYSSKKNANIIWDTHTKGAVLFGWQEKQSVYAGTTDKKVYAINKKDGHVEQVYACDAAVYSCATSENYVFAGDNHSSIYCFSKDGKRLWKLGTGCGSAYSMQYLENKVYIVTTDGSLACIDASETAIKAAQEGNLPKRKNIKAPKPISTSNTTALETITNPEEGVLLKCVREGNKLRVKVISLAVKCRQENGQFKLEISPEYNQDWNVQFPHNLREEGALFVVDEIREANNFYRVFGNIQRLNIS